ncbi:hypothetical protein ACFL42_05165, partial [Candidatus Omnitrophota bacterium]
VLNDAIATVLNEEKGENIMLSSVVKPENAAAFMEKAGSILSGYMEGTTEATADQKVEVAGVIVANAAHADDSLKKETVSVLVKIALSEENLSSIDILNDAASSTDTGMRVEALVAVYANASGLKAVSQRNDVMVSFDEKEDKDIDIVDVAMAAFNKFAGGFDSMSADNKKTMATMAIAVLKGKDASDAKSVQNAVLVLAKTGTPEAAAALKKTLEGFSMPQKYAIFAAIKAENPEITSFVLTVASDVLANIDSMEDLSAQNKKGLNMQMSQFKAKAMAAIVEGIGSSDTKVAQASAQALFENLESFAGDVPENLGTLGSLADTLPKSKEEKVALMTQAAGMIAFKDASGAGTAAGDIAADKLAGLLKSENPEERSMAMEVHGNIAGSMSDGQQSDCRIGMRMAGRAEEGKIAEAAKADDTGKALNLAENVVRNEFATPKAKQEAVTVLVNIAVNGEGDQKTQAIALLTEALGSEDMVLMTAAVGGICANYEAFANDEALASFISNTEGTPSIAGALAEFGSKAEAAVLEDALFTVFATVDTARGLTEEGVAKTQTMLGAASAAFKELAAKDTASAFEVADMLVNATTLLRVEDNEACADVAATVADVLIASVKVDITGPEGVKDGKVDNEDIGKVASALEDMIENCTEENKAMLASKILDALGDYPALFAEVKNGSYLNSEISMNIIDVLKDSPAGCSKLFNAMNSGNVEIAKGIFEAGGFGAADPLPETLTLASGEEMPAAKTLVDKAFDTLSKAVADGKVSKEDAAVIVLTSKGFLETATAEDAPRITGLANILLEKGTEGAASPDNVRVLKSAVRRGNDAVALTVSKAVVNAAEKL